MIVAFTNPSVNPVRVRGFTAARDGAGVLVAWDTASEFRNAGYNLYRRASDGEGQVDRSHGPGLNHAQPHDVTAGGQKAGSQLGCPAGAGVAGPRPELPLVLGRAARRVAQAQEHHLADVGRGRCGQEVQTLLMMGVRAGTGQRSE